MPIWAFTFLRGERGGGARAWEKKVFLVYFSSFLVYLCSRKKEREDLKRAKVRKLTLTPSLMILDLGKNPNLM